MQLWEPENLLLILNNQPFWRIFFVLSCRAYNLHFLGSVTIGNSVMLWKITDATAYTPEKLCYVDDIFGNPNTRS
jgi:hypothetical protein